MTDLMAATAEFTILAFAGLLIAAAASDWRSLTIPNRYSLAIVALFPSYMLVTGNADWAMHLALGSGAFALGFLLFALRLCGGGDVKLFAAVSLWAGPSLFIPFAYYTALAGGLMALVLWLNHKVKRAGIPANLLFVRSDAAFAKQPMPYGVAIAAGGLFVALQLLLKV
ncbi:MAG TPA: prepilin peptidase [Kiloniellaceae bacterium]